MNAVEFELGPLNSHFEPLFITTEWTSKLTAPCYPKGSPIDVYGQLLHLFGRKSEKIFSYWSRTKNYPEESSPFNLHVVIYTHHSPSSPNTNRFQVESLPLLFLWTLKMNLLFTLSVFPISYHTFRVQSFNDLDFYVELNH